MSKVSFVILCLLVGLGDGLRHTTGRMEFGVMRFLIFCCLLALGHAVRHAATRTEVRTHGFTKVSDRSVGSGSYLEQAPSNNTDAGQGGPRKPSHPLLSGKQFGPKYWQGGRLIQTSKGKFKMLDPKTGKVGDDALKCSSSTLHTSEKARVRAEEAFRGLQRTIPNLTSIVTDYMGFHYACDAAEYHGHWVYVNNVGILSGPKWGQPAELPRVKVHHPCDHGWTYYDHSKCGCTPCVKDIGFEFGNQWMMGLCLRDADVKEMGMERALIDGCDAEDGGACKCNIQ